MTKVDEYYEIQFKRLRAKNWHGIHGETYDKEPTLKLIQRKVKELIQDETSYKNGKERLPKNLMIRVVKIESFEKIKIL